MAEVVMHMVRDEVIEHEPDIEDIDSTLEQIDDQVIDLDAVIPAETAESVSGDPLKQLPQSSCCGRNQLSCRRRGAAAAGAVAPRQGSTQTTLATTKPGAGVCSRRSGFGYAPSVSFGRERISSQRQALPPARHSGSLLRHRSGGRPLRHHRAGSHRPDSFGEADGSPHDH